MSAFSVKTLFSSSLRKRCMEKLKTVNIPTATKVKPSAKAAAVLVPLCGVDGEACLFYTVRSSELRENAGQAVFPGGHCDGSETAIAAALRETREETGLDTRLVDVWGVGPTIPGRDDKHIITTVIASIENCCPEQFRLNAAEVQAAFTVPLEVLCDPNNQFYTQFTNGFILPVFRAEQYKIWGITAFITHVVMSALLSKDVYCNNWMDKKVVINGSY